MGFKPYRGYNLEHLVAAAWRETGWQASGCITYVCQCGETFEAYFLGRDAKNKFQKHREETI